MGKKNLTRQTLLEAVNNAVRLAHIFKIATTPFFEGGIRDYKKVVLIIKERA